MKENQNVVVVANAPGSSSLYCRTVIAPLSHQYCYAVPLLSLHCRTAIAPLLFRYRSVVTLLSHLYRTGIAPLLLRCCQSFCRYAVTLLSHRYPSTIAPLLSLLLSLRSPPISNRCRSVVEPRSLRPREGINNSILNCCCVTVTPLSLLLLIGRFTRLSPQEA